MTDKCHYITETLETKLFAISVYLFTAEQEYCFSEKCGIETQQEKPTQHCV